MTHSHHFSEDAAREAADWVLRHDRGLSAAEQDEFCAWLAASALNGAAWAETRWAWGEIDRLAGLHASFRSMPDPDLLSPDRFGRQTSRRWGVWGGAMLALAAALVLWFRPPAPATSPVILPSARLLAPIEQLNLSDGSAIQLNRGAGVTTHFTALERRVRLVSGEAHFKVAHEARPFLVEVAGIVVRAVGTEFTVRVEQSAVDVLVTEGRVAVAGARSADTAGVIAEPVPVSVGERTLVSLVAPPAAPQVEKVSADEIQTRLAWLPDRLDFTDAPMTEILSGFNRRNQVQLILADAELGRLRLSGTFRSDNLEAFLHLMTTSFGVRADWRGDREVVLTRR